MIRQSAREILKAHANDEQPRGAAGLPPSTLAMFKRKSMNPWRITVLYVGLENLLKVVVAGEASTEAKTEAMEILNAIDESLGRPVKFLGLQKIKRDY